VGRLNAQARAGGITVQRAGAIKLLSVNQWIPGMGSGRKPPKYPKKIGKCEPGRKELSRGKFKKDKDMLRQTGNSKMV